MFQLLPNHLKLHQIHKKYAVFSEYIHSDGGWLVRQTSFYFSLPILIYKICT